MAHHELDARGLDCPLPVVHTRRALEQLEPGDSLVVLATDPGAPADFRAFCRMAGHELLEAKEHGACYRFVVRKGTD